MPEGFPSYLFQNLPVEVQEKIAETIANENCHAITSQKSCLQFAERSSAHRRAMLSAMSHSFSLYALTKDIDRWAAIFGNDLCEFTIYGTPVNSTATLMNMISSTSLRCVSFFVSDPALSNILANINASQIEDFSCFVETDFQVERVRSLLPQMPLKKLFLYVSAPPLEDGDSCAITRLFPDSNWLAQQCQQLNQLSLVFQNCEMGPCQALVVTDRLPYLQTVILPTSEPIPGALSMFHPNAKGDYGQGPRITITTRFSEVMLCLDDGFFFMKADLLPQTQVENLQSFDLDVCTKLENDAEDGEYRTSIPGAASNLSCLSITLAHGPNYDETKIEDLDLYDQIRTESMLESLESALQGPDFSAFHLFRCQVDKRDLKTVLQRIGNRLDTLGIALEGQDEHPAKRMVRLLTHFKKCNPCLRMIRLEIKNIQKFTKSKHLPQLNQKEVNSLKKLFELHEDYLEKLSFVDYPSDELLSWSTVKRAILGVWKRSR